MFAILCLASGLTRWSHLLKAVCQFLSRVRLGQNHIHANVHEKGTVKLAIDFIVRQLHTSLDANYLWAVIASIDNHLDDHLWIIASGLQTLALHFATSNSLFHVRPSLAFLQLSRCVAWAIARIGYGLWLHPQALKALTHSNWLWQS